MLRSGYNSDKWHFNAWFMLQLWGLMEFFLLYPMAGVGVGGSLGSSYLILKGN